MVIGGSPSPVLTPEEIHRRRLLITDFWERACGGTVGRVLKTDSIYRVVTEGRDVTPQDQRCYSSCADLAHAGYFAVGVRSPWVNRKEHLGWKVAVNVNRLMPPPAGQNIVADHWHYGATKLDAGDVLVVGTTADTRLHVVCVIDELVQVQPRGLEALNQHVLCTAEYGASGLQVGGIGGHLVSKPWDRWNWGSRVVRVVLRFERVLADAFARGLLVDVP